MANWNPWHGCIKYSEGCRNCYVFRGDERYGRLGEPIHKNAEFTLPVDRKRSGEYKIPSGELVYTCFSSDFFLEKADEWRTAAWDMIRERDDLHFLFITKRITRFYDCIPPDWGEGWNHVTICCTVENQRRADERLPIYLEAPIKHKHIISEPLLGPIDMERWLGGWIEGVTVGGESGAQARVCNYDWVLDIRGQCVRRGVPFRFKQTGHRLLKDGKLYVIERPLQHKQARKAGINIPEYNMEQRNNNQ